MTISLGLGLSLSARRVGVGLALSSPTLLTSLSFDDITTEGVGKPVYAGGVPTSASINSGDASSHWQISSAGVLSPTAAGDADGLDEGPYTLNITVANAEGDDTGDLTISIVIVDETYSVTYNSESVIYNSDAVTYGAP